MSAVTTRRVDDEIGYPVLDGIAANDYQALAMHNPATPEVDSLLEQIDSLHLYDVPPAVVDAMRDTLSGSPSSGTAASASASAPSPATPRRSLATCVRSKAARRSSLPTSGACSDRSSTCLSNGPRPTRWRTPALAATWLERRVRSPARHSCRDRSRKRSARPRRHSSANCSAVPDDAPHLRTRPAARSVRGRCRDLLCGRREGPRCLVAPTGPPRRAARHAETAMTTNGLLAKPLMDAQVHYRQHPPTPLYVLVTGSLRRAGRALLEVAEAMLAPNCERGEQ